MKRTTRILMAFLILGIALFATWQFISYRQKQELSKEKNANMALFVRLEPIFIPIFARGKVIENRQFVIILETRAGIPYRTTLNRILSIRTLIMQDLTVLTERSAPNNIDNIPFVKQQLIESIDRTIGEGIVWGLNFETIFTSPPVL
ncbi:MAG: hypothetical protein QM523_07150 [Candidatus Pacebacteria bacterium]|nr:hypothetical protein [Candidatus Paceibacterota bacterium]